MLKGRQKIILEAAVRGYIKTARPIASAELLDDLNLDISPATVRNEMLKLDELGYLEQPHTSAGRVPTDRGYRFFVDTAVEETGLTKNEREKIRDLFANNTADMFARECSKTISRIARAFAAIGIDDNMVTDRGFTPLENAPWFATGSDDSMQVRGSMPRVSSLTGFTEVLDEPEFQDIDRIRQFGRLIDLLDDDMQMFTEDDEERIFIGGENPMKEAREYTMMITHWSHPRGFNGFLALVGPKRMDYQKNISLIRYINSLYDESDE